jgi:hypothetical protein
MWQSINTTKSPMVRNAFSCLNPHVWSPAAVAEAECALAFVQTPQQNRSGSRSSKARCISWSKTKTCANKRWLAQGSSCRLYPRCIAKLPGIPRHISYVPWQVSSHQHTRIPAADLSHLCPPELLVPCASSQPSVLTFGIRAHICHHHAAPSRRTTLLHVPRSLISLLQLRSRTITTQLGPCRFSCFLVGFIWYSALH